MTDPRPSLAEQPPSHAYARCARAEAKVARMTRAFYDVEQALAAIRDTSEPSHVRALAVTALDVIESLRKDSHL